MLRSLTSLIFIVSSMACVSPLEPLTQDRGIPETLKMLGIQRDHEEGSETAAHVVVIKDRHSARPGFHRVRPQLRNIQRDHRRLIAYLVTRSYGILGCEQPVGLLFENESAAKEFRIIKRHMRPLAELDEYGVFQPARFAMMWPESLAVHGVEDEELYELDRNTWETYVKAMALARRKNRSMSQRNESLKTAARALGLMDKNVHARGEAAARNLVALMQEMGSPRGILLLGGAHIPAALTELRRHSIAFDVFESTHYKN